MKTNTIISVQNVRPISLMRPFDPPNFGTLTGTLSGTLSDLVASLTTFCDGSK